MGQARQNVLVGLFVLFAMGALGGLILMFGQDPTWLIASEKYTLTARFHHASGMRPGTPVTLGGIRVGHVRSVAFRDAEEPGAGVRVVMNLDRELPLRVGTRAISAEPGLGAGRPPIELVPGTEPGGALLVSGSEIEGEVRGFLDSFLPPAQRAALERTAASIGEAADGLVPVLRNIEALTTARETRSVDAGEAAGNISTAVQRLDSALRHLDEVLGDANVQRDLRGTLANAHAVSEEAKVMAGDLRQFAADARQLAADGRQTLARVDTVLSNVDERTERLTRELTGAVEQAGRLLTQLNEVTARAAAGEGTVGRLLTDDRLYEALVLTFQRLGEATEELRLLLKDWQQGRIRVTF